MKKFALTFVIAMLLYAVVSVPGCDKSRKIPNKIPTNFDYGSWTESTYRNDFFGFSVTVPKNWHISGQEEIKAIIEEGKNLDFMNKKEAEKQLKIAEVTTANLFMVARYTEEESMEKEESNPNIVLAAENISLPGKKIDHTQYINIYRQNLPKSIPSLVIKSQTNKMIGGQEFTSLQMQFTLEGMTISQEHLICVKNGFAILFGLTFLDDSDKQQLDDIMATLKWD